LKFFLLFSIIWNWIQACSSNRGQALKRFGQEAQVTRAFKLGLCLFALLMFRYVPVYYHTIQFNQYVQDQVPRIRMQGPLREAILSKAEEHNLNVTAEDIMMTTTNSVLSVAVEYHVPVNFYVFRQDLKFRAGGSGLLLKGY